MPIVLAVEISLYHKTHFFGEKSRAQAHYFL